MDPFFWFVFFFLKSHSDVVLGDCKTSTIKGKIQVRKQTVLYSYHLLGTDKIHVSKPILKTIDKATNTANIFIPPPNCSSQPASTLTGPLSSSQFS